MRFVRLLAAGCAFGLGCSKPVSDPGGTEVTDAAKRISEQGALHLLDQNDVRIALDPGTPNWTFESEPISDLKVLKVTEKPGIEFPLTAVVRFKVRQGERTHCVEGWIRYRQSQAFAGMIQRANDADWYQTVRVWQE